MSNTPVFPQALLGVLVRADARDAVCGDLLEEYRDLRVPALGELRARLWYWRQVLGMWLRAYWWLVVPVILLLATGDIFNTFRAPSGASYLDSVPLLVHVPRLPLLPLAVAGCFALAGAYGSWRTQQFAGGQVAALGMFVILWLFMASWESATFRPFVHVQQSNPFWIQAWQWSIHRAHAPGVSFANWMFWDNMGSLLYGGLFMLLASIICGGTGSALGCLMAARNSAAVKLRGN